MMNVFKFGGASVKDAAGIRKNPGKRRQKLLHFTVRMVVRDR